MVAILVYVLPNVEPNNVREICERYELPYTTGPLPKQVASAWAKVFRLALP